MADLTLGVDNDVLTVRLNSVGDFVAGLDSDDGAWPGTAHITLMFNDSAATEWEAVIVGIAADWNVDKAEVAALIDRFPAHPRARLMYRDGATDLPWAEGRVSVKKGW